MPDNWRYRAESDPKLLEPHLAAIVALGDCEKEALGFLPGKAFEDALWGRRIVAMLARRESECVLAGYILFSGVFPYAKVQQIAVAPAHRRQGVGEALINILVSNLERREYQLLKAAVASNLPAAQAFYEKQGFVARIIRAGGTARGRQIIVRARELDNTSLMTLMEVTDAPRQSNDLGLTLKGAGPAPLFVIDINVLFDVVKAPGRPRAPMAERVICAALGHSFRLTIAHEFLVELERNSRGSDPILSLAKQLPRLPPTEDADVKSLCDRIHDIIFVRTEHRGAGSVTAKSDCRHLAEAALARASGYVTSDGAMLNVREELRQEIGIDVVSLDEFAGLLTDTEGNIDDVSLQGSECQIGTANFSTLRAYFYDLIDADTRALFLPDAPTLGWLGLAIRETDEVRGAAILVRPASLDQPCRAIAHVKQDQLECEVLSDKLIDLVTEEACSVGPTLIELHVPKGQAVVRQAARARGYATISQTTLTKVAIGTPLTETSWDGVVANIRRKSGLILPNMPLAPEAVTEGIDVKTPHGQVGKVRLPTIEAALAPTILAWPGREGVIVSIAKAYADDLLQTTAQLPLFGWPVAAFVSRRTYICSPRAEGALRPSRPIFFYESSRTGGAAAIIAAGLIVDTLVSKKEEVSVDLLRRSVVDEVDDFSTSGEVLAVSFDSVLKFPRCVPLDVLRDLGAATNNFQTATRISGAIVKAILDYGWSRV